MKLAFKYRFYPTKEQADLLNRTFGCVRYVYNFGLALRRDTYDERGHARARRQHPTNLTPPRAGGTCGSLGVISG